MEQLTHVKPVVGEVTKVPARNYKDKDVCFVYVTAIAQNYRHTRVFLDGYRAVMKMLAGSGFTEVRRQAAKGNPYTNRLYARLFRPAGEAVNRRGFPVNQYSLPFEEAAQRLSA